MPPEFKQSFIHGLQKFRLYICPTCGRQCSRPLNQASKPCDRCGTGLAGLLYQVQDYRVFLRDLLRKAGHHCDIELDL